MSEFKTMDEIVNRFFSQPAFPKLAYCDYIAKTISTALKTQDIEHLIDSVGRIQYDEMDSKLLSSKKTIMVSDVNGKEYRITVEEV